MSQLIRKIDGFIDYKYNDRVNLYLETVFLDKYKDIDLSFYDSGETQNKLQHVQNIKNSVVGLSSNLFSVLEYLIRMIWAFVLLTQLNFWVGPVSVLLFLPVILCQIKTNQITIKYDKDKMQTAGSRPLRGPASARSGPAAAGRKAPKKALQSTPLPV